MRLETVIDRGAGLVQRGGDADAHLAGADDEHVAAGERAEPVGDHLDGGVADRRRAAADAVSVRARLPTLRAWRNSRSSVERTPPSSLATCHAVRTWPRISLSPSTAESSPAATSKRCWRGGLVVLAVEVRVQLVGAQRAELAEEVADVGVGAVEALGDGVDLGAVARAEHGDLAEVVAGGEADDGLGDVARGDRQPLEDRQRARAVVDPDDDDRHGGSSLGAGPPSGTGRYGLQRRAVGGRAALLVVAEDLQLDGEVDLADVDRRAAPSSTTGAKLRMLVTPAATSRSAASWAAAAGVATTPIDTCVGCARSAARSSMRADADAADHRADLGGVDVDDAGDREAALAEPAVAGERLAEVAGADDDDGPVVGQAELAADLVDRGTRPRSRRRGCRSVPR